MAGTGNGGDGVEKFSTARARELALTTLYDVARIAGVSTATVSRVVHGHDRVRAATRARVLGVIAELGYVPDGAAQSLSRRRKEVIGLVSIERVADEDDVESMSLLFADEVLRGVEKTLRDQGWSLLISFFHDAEHAFSRLQNLSGKVDGLLLTEGIVPSEQLAVLAARLPVVVVSGRRDERCTDVVVADNHAGTVELVAHLVEVHDRRRFFFVAGPDDAPDALERRGAYDEVLRGHPSAVSIGSFDGLFSAMSGEAAAREILGRFAGELPDAVVCANDQMAIGVLRVLADAGIEVPGAIAVVGFDDIYPGALWNPSLTTVRQPMRALGERASSRLLERIADPDLEPCLEILATELVLRRSCGCEPGAIEQDARSASFAADRTHASAEKRPAGAVRVSRTGARAGAGRAR